MKCTLLLIESFAIKSKTRNCKWVRKKKNIRCLRFSQASDHCPRTCGKCNSSNRIFGNADATSYSGYQANGNATATEYPWAP